MSRDVTMYHYLEIINTTIPALAAVIIVGMICYTVYKCWITNH